MSLFLFIERTKKSPHKRVRSDSKRRLSVSSKAVSWSKIRLEGGLDQINTMIQLGYHHDDCSADGDGLSLMASLHVAGVCYALREVR